MGRAPSPDHRRSLGITTTTLLIGLIACTTQASAQIVATKSRGLTPQEKRSAIAFTGEKPEEILAVKGMIATFSQAGRQNIGAEIVWKEFVFSDGLCLAPMENLSAERKVGDKSIHWKVARTYSHHLPPGLSSFVWQGNTNNDCKKLPESDLVSIDAPIPTLSLKVLISNRHTIKSQALQLLQAKESNTPDGYYEHLIADMRLEYIGLVFDWKRGFVYTARYTGNSHSALIVPVVESGNKAVPISAGIAMP